MAKQKMANKGPYIKNAHLIGKGGGQVKPVNGSFVKGLKKGKPSPSTPSPNVRKHIKTEPAKNDPGNSPARRRQLSLAKKVVAPKPMVKKTPSKTPITAKKGVAMPKPIPKVVSNKKAPTKSAIAKVQSSAKKYTPPKKVAAPRKTIAKGR